MTLFSDILSIPSNPEDFFTLLSPIGSGAFGHVYKAIHKESKKIFAIKIIQYFKDDINYLDNNCHIDNINFCYKTVQQETSLMRLVNSSNYIVKYYGSYFSRKSNTLWLIIEYCSSGSTIDLMLAMDRTYTEIELATIIKMVLKGLILIHEKNLIHRDIKGANILLSEEGYAKLGDFGVGVELKEEFYRTSKKGSPYWMSPQVIKKEEYDSKTDIWSLGITCIELLQGEPPNSGLSPEGVMEKIGNKLFKFEDFFGGEKDNYSKEFKNFLYRCLVIDPKNRANAKELIKHPFILKYAKDNIFLKNLVKKHKYDIEKYRKEVEEYENQMKNNKNYKDENKISNIINSNKNNKKEDFSYESKKMKILEKSIDFNKSKNKKESYINNSYFNYIKQVDNFKGKSSRLTNLLSNYEHQNLSDVSHQYSNSKDNFYYNIEDINIVKMNNSILNINKTNNNKIKYKVKSQNNSFRNDEYIQKMDKSRNIKKHSFKKHKTGTNTNIYYTKSECLFKKGNKCQIINFKISMKKTINEKKNNDEKNSNIIYSKKIVLNKGKQKINNDKKFHKIKSEKNIKSTNSNINTDFNTDNFSISNNNSFILNSVSLKNIINKNNLIENKKKIKLKIQSLSNVEDNKIVDEETNIYSGIVTDDNIINNYITSTNIIGIDNNNNNHNNISHTEEIPSLNLDKLLKNNENKNSRNLVNKEENINDNDDDCLINKVKHYRLNDNDLMDKENHNILNFNNMNINNTTDTIHSYSIIDSKDSVLTINSSNKYFNEAHKKYFI